MADGHFPTLVSKDRLPNSATNTIYVSMTDGTDTALIDGSGNLQVILAANDGVDIGDVTVNNGAGAAAVNIQDGGNSITIDDGGTSITVDGTVSISGTVTVTATDLDIRDLTHVSDSVKIGDGTDFLAVNADGSINVVASNPSVAVDDSAFTVATDSLTVIGGIATSDSVDAGDLGALRMLTNRALVTTLEDANGDGIAIDASGNLAAILAANSGVDIGDVTINNAAGASAVNIQDGGNSITVDGTVAATQSGVWDIGTVTTLTGITNDVNIADGGNSITVDGTVAVSSVGGTVTVTATDLDIRSLTSVSDSVEVLQDTHDDLNANANLQVSNTDVSASNPVPVTITDPVVSSTEIHNYDTASAVAGDASDNHDLTASGGVFVCKQISFAASGGGKVEVINDATGTPATVWVGFIPKEGGVITHTFNPALEVADADVLRLTRTNRQGAAQDLYSTIEGNQL